MGMKSLKWEGFVSKNLLKVDSMTPRHDSGQGTGPIERLDCDKAKQRNRGERVWLTEHTSNNTGCNF